MKNLKVIGWLLLIIGLIVIILTLFSSYNIFTGKQEAPLFFEMESESITVAVSESQEEIEKIMEDQISKMIPNNTVPKMLNLTVWSMLAFILILGGSHVSGIGVKLIKESKV